MARRSKALPVYASYKGALHEHKSLRMCIVGDLLLQPNELFRGCALIAMVAMQWQEPRTVAEWRSSCQNHISYWLCHTIAHRRTHMYCRWSQDGHALGLGTWVEVFISSVYSDGRSTSLTSTQPRYYKSMVPGIFGTVAEVASELWARRKRKET